MKGLIFLDKADILISSLAPEIDKKCTEIRNKKSEKLLTRIFILISAAFLIIPTILIFFGISPVTIFIPVIFISAVLLAASPVITMKGELLHEQV